MTGIAAMVIAICIAVSAAHAAEPVGDDTLRLPPEYGRMDRETFDHNYVTILLKTLPPADDQTYNVSGLWFKVIPYSQASEYLYYCIAEHDPGAKQVLGRDNQWYDPDVELRMLVYDHFATLVNEISYAYAMKGDHRDTSTFSNVDNAYTYFMDAEVAKRMRLINEHVIKKGGEIWPLGLDERGRQHAMSFDRAFPSFEQRARGSILTINFQGRTYIRNNNVWLDDQARQVPREQAAILDQYVARVRAVQAAERTGNPNTVTQVGGR